MLLIDSKFNIHLFKINYGALGNRIYQSIQYAIY